MKKAQTIFFAAFVLTIGCKKPAEDPGRSATIADRVTIATPELNAEQMAQVRRLNNDSKMFDYAKACNEVFLHIIPGSSQASLQALARNYLQPKLNALRTTYSNDLLKRADANKILRTSLEVQVSKLPKVGHEGFFNSDPCREGFENGTKKCQDDFFSDLPGCGAVALASTLFAPEMGVICVAGLGLKAMACRNWEQRNYIGCMEKVVHPGDFAYFQKDTIIRGQKFRVGSSININNASLNQYLEQREVLKKKWMNMSLAEWLRHPVLTTGATPTIKFR